MSAIPQKQESIDELLTTALYNLAHIDERYQQADVLGKRSIIGSIFPEKLTFSENGYRTTRINEAVRLIYTIDKGFAENKMGQNGGKSDLSQEVIRIGFEPMTLSLEG